MNRTNRIADRLKRFKARMARRYSLRFHMSLLLSGVIGSGVLANKALYELGLGSFKWRYPISVIASYLGFFILLRLWLIYATRRGSRRSPQSSFDAGSGGNGFTDLGVSGGGTSSTPSVSFSGGGGKSGGGGASGSWAPSGGGGSSGGGSGGGLNLGDDAGAVLVLIAFAILLAVILGGGVYLIFQGPEILGEVLFEAALSTGLIRATRKMHQPGWIGGVVRSTWIPFTLVLLVAAGFGALAEAVCPKAKRMGEVLQNAETACLLKLPP